MKQLLSKVLVVLLVALVIGGGTAAYNLFHDPNAGKEVSVATHPTMIDSSGNSHMVVVDTEGTSYAVVTDTDGNRYAAEFNGNQIGSTVGQINDQVALEDLPTTNPAGHVVVTNDPSAYVGDIVTTVPTSPQEVPTVPSTTTGNQGASDYVPQNTQPSAPNTQAPVPNSQTSTPNTQPSVPNSQPSTPNTQSSVPNTQPSTPNTQPSVPNTQPSVPNTQPSVPNTQPSVPDSQPSVPTTDALVPYRIDKYQQILASGTYLMEITTNDPDLGDTPITMAVKDGNMYVDTTLEGITCQIVYDRRTDTMYTVFPTWKKYCKLPEDLMGEDLDMTSMMDELSFDDIASDISVSYVDLNGQQLILESYTSSIDGSTVNYYFNGDELVRRDNISKNGVTDSIYISRFLSDVPDSYFEIPDGYGYLNLSWMGAFM